MKDFVGSLTDVRHVNYKSGNILETVQEKEDIVITDG